jgi:putative copper resistance protein D
MRQLVAILLFSFLTTYSTVTPTSVKAEGGGECHHSQRVETLNWEGSQSPKDFSKFNHHLGGLFVLLMGGASLLEALGKFKKGWTKLFWPIPLLLLGAYFLILSDRNAWPVGTMSFQESLSDPEILQHKSFALIMTVLGVIELLRRQQILLSVLWVFLSHAIMVLPGLLLLVHSSVMSVNHHSHEIYAEHLIMGSIALLVVAGRFLHESELWRWRYSGFVWPSLVFLLGVQLLLYNE